MTIRPYMSKLVFDKLTSLYTNKEEALNRAVSGFLLMRSLSLRTVSGVFSRPEMIGMVAAFNGTIITLDMGIPPKQMLIGQMQDAQTYESNADFYEYDGLQLLRKLEALTELEALFLLEEIHRFWNETNGRDLEEFLDKLSEH